MKSLEARLERLEQSFLPDPVRQRPILVRFVRPGVAEGPLRLLRVNSETVTRQPEESEAAFISRVETEHRSSIPPQSLLVMVEA